MKQLNKEKINKILKMGGKRYDGEKEKNSNYSAFYHNSFNFNNRRSFNIFKC